ncbi:fungal-specific transcription factor domain-containing protein [Linnemannia elongata]|nr:fungal-specific transcription factor domain-containing protein [Linnemannia elongata]
MKNSFIELDGLSSSSSKPRPVRLILPAQSLSAPRLLQPTSFDDFSSKRHSLAKKHHTTPHHLQQQPPLSLTQNQQQQQRTSQTPGDVLYSLSTASIRARKNALEMENIQRANQLYEEYIAKIKAVSESISPAPTTTGGTIPIYQDDPMNSHRMDIDPTDFASNTGSYNPYPNKPARLSPLGEKDFGPIEGLERMLRSGMLHNLVQQYFTLIHPQFMILHKNQFLFRFWAEYGPFPEAYEIHNQFIEKPCSGSCAAEGDVVVHKASCSAVAAPAAMTEPSSSSQAPVKSSYRNSPLLLLSMMALVSRHLNDRSPMKSTIEEKHRRVQKSLSLYSHDQKVIEHRCQEKLQEGKLQELMETDEHGHRDLDGENFRDRGEQYFYWATELLKFEYEEPSLTVIQSLLLLREYAVMAGSHTQAYMYGGTAITMALVLGWDRAHLRQNTRNGAYGQSGSQEFAQGSEEEKVEQEKQRENKAKDEEQRLCWWQCFIVDRWMSAAYNRPVNIPVHVFDKTHLGPPPKIISISRPGDDSNTPSTTGKMDLEMLPMGLGVSSPRAVGLPPAQYRAKLFFDQQCRQALILDDILAFLSTWSEELFVNPAEFDKLSGALDEWHQDLADWQTFPLSGIVAPPKSSSSRPSTQKFATTIPVTTLSNDGSSRDNKQSQQERRDIVQSTLLGITFHTIRILLYRPFLRTNLRHPPCIPSRASLACAQSANAMTSLAESLINLTDATVQPCLLMRHQFSLVTAAGIQLMNASLEDEPRLSTPAKINLLKTIRILRDADRSTFGPPPQVGVGANGVRDGFHQVLRELFPGQMKHMPDLLGPSTSST